MATRNRQTTQLVSRKTKCRNVKLDTIQIDEAFRIEDIQTDKKFKALKKSIKAQGIITPIIVKMHNDESYSIIDGIRRYLAAKELGYKKLKVTIYEELDNSESILGLVANSNQKTLTPIELGIAYKKLIDRGAYANKAELARALGISEGTVGAKIKNLEMDSEIIEKLIEGNGIRDQKVLKAIRIFSPVDENGTSEQQRNLFNHIVENNLGRKEALEYIKSQQEPEIVSERMVSLAQNSVIDLHIDTSDLDEARRERIQELVAEIEAIRQEAEGVAA